jgi:hypothetical protein
VIADQEAHALRTQRIDQEQGPRLLGDPGRVRAGGHAGQIVDQLSEDDAVPEWDLSDLVVLEPALPVASWRQIGDYVVRLSLDMSPQLAVERVELLLSTSQLLPAPCEVGDGHSL